jgi:hypothetical protein
VVESDGSSVLDMAVRTAKRKHELAGRALA